MTSKERLLNAIECKEVEYIPCSFMLFHNLAEKCNNRMEFVEEEVKLGLDAVVNVGNLEMPVHPDVTFKEWIKEEDGIVYFFRKIETPKGPLTQKIKQKNNWPTKEKFPIIDDFIVPRTVEPLVKPEEDLEKLKYLLGPFSQENIIKLREEAKIAKSVADKHVLLQVAGEIGRVLELEGSYSLIMGADAMSWFSGFENIMTLSLTEPQIIKEYANIISDWNIKQLDIYLDVTDVDLLVRRAWYETSEFWTPKAYENIILPTLKKEVDFVHKAGKKYGYIITSAWLPLVDFILDSGIDVLIGLDPQEGRIGNDMSFIKKKFSEKKIALWGGVNGATVVEMGTAKETEKAVKDALETFGKDSGFILSPIDNVRVITPNAWENTHIFIDTWKKHRNN